MSSVQDHTPVVQELSERQGSQPTQPGQPQSVQPQVLPRTRDAPRPPREITSEAPREYSPPRFSQLLDALPEGSEPHPPMRGISSGTNSVTLVNHPGTVGDPSNDGGMQNTSVTQERSQNQLSPTSDRRPQIMYDPIRGDNTPVRVQLSDDGDHGRGSVRRVSVPRPRPVFNPVQDGSGNGNSPRVALRGASGGDLSLHLQQLQEPQKTVQERIQPTLDAAIQERNKYKKQARLQGIMINGAIGLQVIVGALTTGVAAGSKNIGSTVAVLGGISTALASYLAKARGSGEPESSNLRSRELSTFIREVQAFILDKGHKVGTEFDIPITIYRERFELIIKTEGEDSTSGTGYASHSRGQHPSNFHPVPSQQQMAMMHGGGQYMPQGNGGMGGQLSEKQQMWNEKAPGRMV